MVHCIVAPLLDGFQYRSLSLSLSVEEITLSWVECISAIFVQFVQFDSACRRGESVQ